MSKLLTSKELLNEINNIVFHYEGNNSIPNEILTLLNRQKIVHADYVIGPDATDEETMSDNYGIHEAQDNLRFEQRGRNHVTG